MSAILAAMPTDEQLTFADHVGRYFMREQHVPPVAGRLLGYLAVCEPAAQTINDLCEALLASRSAITNAVKALETMRQVRRTRTAGERMDRVRIDLSTPQSMGLDVTEYEELRDLTREGLEVLRNTPAERRAVLLETAAFADFVIEQVVRMRQEWEARRRALVAAGELPERPAGGGRP